MSMLINQPDRPEWDRLQGWAVLMGAGFLVVCVFVALVYPDQFFRSYLVAYNFWLGIGLGCLVILMIQYLTGGAWGIVLRRVLESGSQTLLLLAVLFLPLVAGLPQLYVWARPDALAADPTLQHKSLYLNVPFFLVRAFVYFVSWLALVFMLLHWSRRQDLEESPGPWRRFRMLSGPGLIVYGLTITFASIDWGMSIDPHWFSTIYPVLFATGQLLTALAFAVAVLIVLAQRPPLSEVILPTHLRDLGNLLLTFVMLWAYMQISQFLLIWSGNLPEEIPWYLERTRGAWQWVALLLVLCHFALPFLLLLSQDIKRNGRLMLAVALGLLAMRFIDIFWWIEPAYAHDGQPFYWLLDIALLLGLGGVWLGTFLWLLKRRPLLPIHDPDLAEALHHE